eukprot:6491371-Amphidinium_carterae.4
MVSINFASLDADWPAVTVADLSRKIFSKALGTACAPVFPLFKTESSERRGVIHFCCDLETFRGGPSSSSGGAGVSQKST